MRYVRWCGDAILRCELWWGWRNGCVRAGWGDMGKGYSEKAPSSTVVATSQYREA